MKVKIFNNSTSIKDLEEEINQFIQEEEVEILSINTSITPMHDLFHDCTVRNQWEEYTCVLLYNELTATFHP